MKPRALRTRTSSAAFPENSQRSSRRKTTRVPKLYRRTLSNGLPHIQTALILPAVHQQYTISELHAIPDIQHEHEVLVKVLAAGLNPIDWKSPDYNFGIPTLPYISGRELVGTVVKAAVLHNSRVREGDVVIVPSTDYRDLRKAAFQEYCIASSFNIIRLPRRISINSGSVLGVAFVSAALALGVCMGLNYESIEDGPDLLGILKHLSPDDLPDDIRRECLEGISKGERATSGDWLILWGGNSVCAFVAKQIARLFGMKIVSVVDTLKHGLRLSSSEVARPDLLVDSHDSQRAIEIVRAATNGCARFGFDTQSKDTAAHLLKSLNSEPTSLEWESQYQLNNSKLPTPPATSSESPPGLRRSHLVGLTGLPTTDLTQNIALHSVPIKLFHENSTIGEELCVWCERLLAKDLLVPPNVVGTVKGLQGINEGLDRMRRREVRGGRLVAVLP